MRTTTTDCDLQARIFLQTLYAGQPDGSLISISERLPTGWGRSRFLRSPEEALPHVVGAVDVYVRITLLANRPASGRGTAADAIALPGLWAEFDIDRAPDSKGQPITGAFPSLEAALELAHRVLEPTMTVQSGYGLHCYWLLHDMLELADEQARERAARLVQGFQTRLRELAREEYGIGKLDATHDLARVFRPPGSFNNKGAEPVLVELLDDGGHRYALEELREHTAEVAPMVRIHNTTTATGDVSRLLDRHPRLAKIADRKGTKPGDGTPSAWDHYLACTAGELQLSDEEIAELLRHTRAKFGEQKGEREDYIERTIAAARATVGYPLRDPEEILPRLTERMRLDQVDRRVVDVRITGHGNAARVTVLLDDRSRIVFPRFKQVTNAAELQANLATSTGVIADISKPQATEIAALMRRYVGTVKDVDELEDMIDWLHELLQLGIDTPYPHADGTARWQVWGRLSQHDPSEGSANRTAEGYASKILIGRDVATGMRYVRARWLQEYIRRLGGPNPHEVRQLVEHAGWTRPNAEGRIKATNPAGTGSLGLSFYVVPADWRAGS